MKSNKYILSICIPTFNGGDKLVPSLNVLSDIVQARDDIEVVISDNCSTDNTHEILSNYDEIPNFIIHRNCENLGLNGNLSLLIDNYARGKYCWIIGDDDYIDKDAVDKIITILKNESPSYVSLRHRDLKLCDYFKLEIDKKRDLEYFRGNYFECIDYNASHSNILGTFMSTQIFLLEKVKELDRSDIGVNTWSDFRTTFPNSYMMTQLFFNDHNCICIHTPVLTALSHPKSWDGRMYDITMTILPSYYNYCIKLGGGNILPRTKKVLHICMLSINKNELKKFNLKKVNWQYIFSFSWFPYLVSYLLKR